MDLKGKKINFLGDSITEGLRTSSEAARFSNLIAERYDAICRNYGISGTKIALRDDEAHERAFVVRYKDMDDDADIVVVMGSTNDCGAKNPFGTFDSRDDYTFYGALHNLYTGLINKYPDSTIVVMTPPHYLEEGDPTRDDSLRAYVDVIREVAEYYSLPLLDLYATGKLQPAVPVLKEKYMPDGCHPNDEGHKILAQKISSFLLKL